MVHLVPLYVAGHVHVFGALHVPPFEHVGEQTGIVHIVPLYVAGHVHVFGALHVPPFEHVGEQTALRRK